jgi:hypothetical protein
MRSTSDFFGLLAYLTLMFGRLPDRELLDAAYAATSAQQDEHSTGYLTLVPQPVAVDDDAERVTSAA